MDKQTLLYKQLQMEKRLLDGMIKSCELKGPEIKRLADPNTRFEGFGHTFPKERGFTQQSGSRANNFIRNSMLSIRDCRREIRKVESAGIIEIAKRDTELMVRHLMATLFPRIQFSTVHAVKKVEDWATIGKHGVSIFVNVAWTRSVYANKIDHVKDGSKWHIVLRAKRRNIDRLMAEDISVYDCLTISKDDIGRGAKLYEAWVMAWSSDQTTITACSDTFAGAEKLLRRRIKKQVTDALLGF